jgi:hypothetical protein
MRKNIASVIDAFHAQESYQDKTCRTDGKCVYSYALLIAVRHGATVYVLDPSESPSRTTTSQIRAVLAAFPGARIAGDERMLHYLLSEEAEEDGQDDAPRGPSRGDREDFHADG